MIYLIKSAAYTEEKGLFFLLKIGYASNVEKRLKAYKTHNPEIVLLKTREGGYALEKYLHQYFKEFAYTQDEWFYYNDKIINEFESVNFSLDIENGKKENNTTTTINISPPNELKETLINKIPSVKILEGKYLTDLLNSLMDTRETLYVKRACNEIWNTLNQKLLDSLDSFNFNSPEDIESFFKYFDIHNIKNEFYQDIKNKVNITKEIINSYLNNNLDTDPYFYTYFFEDNYLSVDEDGQPYIDTALYKLDIKIFNLFFREFFPIWEISFQKEQLDKDIENFFEIHQILSKEEIKEILLSLYQKYQTPIQEANYFDILEWFDIKLLDNNMIEIINKKESITDITKRNRKRKT